MIPTLLAQDLPRERFRAADLRLELDRRYRGISRRRFAPSIRTCVTCPAPYSGRAVARNAGIDAAAGAIVLFNDSDILASPDLLSTHLARHRERAKIAVVGWEVQVKDLDDYAFKREHPRRRAGSLHPESRKTLPWLYFLTGNASVPRDDLLRVGCFDESFTGYGHEDLELGYRLERAGLEIVYEPKR